MATCTKGTSSPATYTPASDATCTTCPAPAMPTSAETPGSIDNNINTTIANPTDLGIEIETVTKIFVDQDGVFDNYENAIYQQLKRHYEEGRIKGAEFANAHTQMTIEMMKDANQYVLQKYQVDATIAAQKIELGDKLLTSAYQRELVKQQVINARIEGELLAQKVRTEKLQQQMLITQEEETRKSGAVQRSLTTAQANQSAAQKELIDSQRAELVANGLSKRALEDGQNNVAAAQCELYNAQATGFEKKDKNDTFRTIMNAWAVSVSEQNNDTPPPSLQSGSVNNTIGTAKSGTGLS